MGRLEEKSKAEQRSNGFGIDFIDPLFAVAVHLGLSHYLAEQPWFKEGRLPAGDQAFVFWTFLLGLVTLVWSWIGYHQSIRGKALKGLLRFALDVALVVLYAVILLQAERLGVVLNLIVIVYFLFFLWDWAKMGEHPEQYPHSPYPWSYPRELVTIVYLLLFGALALAFHFIHLPKLLALGLAFVLTVSYRFSKLQPWRWRRIDWRVLWFGPRNAADDA